MAVRFFERNLAQSPPHDDALIANFSVKNPDSDGSPVQGVSGNRRTGGRDLVQSPDDNSPLTLTFVLKDPGSLQDDQCPSLYRTSRRTWIIQADRRDEPDVRAQARALAPHEGLGEVTDDFMDVIARTYVKERYGLDIPG